MSNPAPLDKMTTKEMQEACRIFESNEAEDAYRKVCEVFGDSVAKLLLITHVRLECGSMDTRPNEKHIGEILQSSFQRLGIS